MKFWLQVYWEGLKEYFSTLLSAVISAMVLVGEPTWLRKLIAFLVVNLIMGALVAMMVYCKKKLDEELDYKDSEELILIRKIEDKLKQYRDKTAK